MADPKLRDEIGALLSGEVQSAFSPSLAALYEARKGTARRQHLAIALGLTAAAVLVAAILDRIDTPVAFAQHLAMRGGVILLCLAGAACVLRMRPGLPEAAAFGLPLLAQVILSAWMSAAASPPMIDRNILMCLILFAVLCAVPPVPPAVTRRLAVIWFCGFMLTLWLALGGSAMVHHLPALAGGGVALAIGAGLATRREAARQREFLHVVQSELITAELRHANAELERLMNTDVLTGVANRRWFENDMQSVWQANAATGPDPAPIGLIIIDVDHFKSFNDCAGHAAGDACLRSIATAISAVVRGGPFGVARWGGEEFVVLAAGIPRRDMEGLAERVRRAVESLAIPHPALPGQFVTVSVGGAWAGADHAYDSPHALLCEADNALYAAKTAGRNCVAVAAEAPEPQRIAVPAA